MELKGNDLFGATPILDVSELIPDYITTKSELYDAEFKNISQATSKYLLMNRQQHFSIKFLCVIHRDMFCNVWKWAGCFRSMEMNIGVKPFAISTELQNLIKDSATTFQDKFFRFVIP